MPERTITLYHRHAAGPPKVVPYPERFPHDGLANVFDWFDANDPYMPIEWMPRWRRIAAGVA